MKKIFDLEPKSFAALKKLVYKFPLKYMELINRFL